jgi:hypothetical protein
MKTYRLLARLGQPLARPWRRLVHSRRGTVIIVVLALLGMLVLIGFFTFAYTASENQSATYFDNTPTAKVLSPTLDADALFNNVLRQVIIGPAATEKQTALYGGRNALVPSMFGRDLAPFNGPGINLIWNTTLNQASVDQNYDGYPDDGTLYGTSQQSDNRALTFLNLSPSAAVAWQSNTTYVTGAFVRPNANPQTNFLYIATTPGTSGATEPAWPALGGTVTDGTITWIGATSLDLNNYPYSTNPLTRNLYPDPDLNATYPDINSAFLSYDALVPAPASASPALPIRLITPSYHRPQYLRNATAAGAAGANTVPVANWYIDPLTAARVLYPHVEHTAIDVNGNITTTQRFVSYTHPDTSTAATGWAAATAYTVGQLVYPTGTGAPTPPTFNYLCTQAGTSGGTQPAWPTVPSQPVNDGTVTWSEVSLPPFTIPGDPVGTGTQPQEGVWSSPTVNPANASAINYAVDTDLDSVNDANYMDVGFPLMTTPSGTQFVAMPAIKIIDADALFNLNAHGNRSGSVVVPSPGLPSNLPFGGLGTLPGTTQFISHSNLGLSASEVNIEWAFNATPVAGSADFPGTQAALATALQQYTSFFRSPAQSGTLPVDNHSAGIYELANMEWWNILNGRPQLTPGTPATVSGSSLPGRWGENVTRLDPNVQLVLAGTTVAGGLGTPGGDPWPLPGLSAGYQYVAPTLPATTPPGDDNNNFAETGQFHDEQGVVHPAFVTPLDVFAAGSWVTGTEGKVRQLFVQGEQKYAQYTNYFTNNNVLWTQFFNSNPSVFGPLMSGGGAQFLIDEPDETFLEPSAAATQPNDNIFGPGESTVQFQGTDFTNFGSSARSPSLAPFNMSASARAGQIRQRFTPASWDLKSFGKEFLGPYSVTPVNDARRLWEFTDTSAGQTGAGPFRFPPDIGGGTGGNPVIQAPAITVTTYSAYPLRPDVAHLLWTVSDPNQQLGTTALLMPQRPLSINGLTEQVPQVSNNSSYTFRIRPLTPHPTATNPFPALPNTPIVPPSHTSDGIGYTISTPENLQSAGGTVQQQEWLARYDRQRLARDIYTLLYLNGGGSDVQNYAMASNQPVAGVRPVYTDDQLQEMAQFAVNLVDQLDPDSNITVFEYDKDLSNGWNLDDNAYDGTADLQPPFNILPADRGVVYGVERQQLAFNEAMIAFSQQAVDTTVTPNVAWNHPDTQWNDILQWAAIYLELDNIGPSTVNFNNTQLGSQQWEIAVKQSPVVQVPSLFYGAGTTNNSGERRLIFTQGQLVAGAAPVAGVTNSRLTIGGLIGSPNGVTYSQINAVAGNPTIPYPSYLVVDPNDTSGTPQNTGVDYQFPIAPRAAYVSVATPPFNNTTALGLDLTQPGTSGQYLIVPPNSADPTGNADGLPSAINVPAGVSPGTQLLNFTDPITEASGTISSAIGAHIFPESALVLRLELRRRVDPYRTAVLPTDTNELAENADNPWIVVDHMDVPISVLALKKTGNNSDYYLQIENQLGSPAALADPAPPSAPYHHYISTGGAMPLVSTERSQPLYHDFTLNPFNPTGSPNQSTPNGPYLVASATVYPRNGGVTTLKTPVWQGNSLGQDNDAAGFDPGTVSGTPIAALPHPLYQPHYDRDFASIIELFNVPTWGPYGPASLTTMNVPGISSGNTIALASGLTHLMATRTNEAGTPVAGAPYAPEVLGGTDFLPNDAGSPRQHHSGYGVAGYRFQHPEGGGLTPPNPTADPTENRWHRLLGLVEVPTRSHRELEEPPYQITAGTLNGPLGFYRTPGKINLNTIRHPDVLAGLLDENDIYTLAFSTQFPASPPSLNFPQNLQVPFSLPDQNGDVVVNPPIPLSPPYPANTRDWWLQFLAARDGVDPLPTAIGGTNLSLPGMPRYPSGTAPPSAPNAFSTLAAVAPGSHPFRGQGFSAYASAPGSTSGGEDANGYNSTLDSNILRALTGDQVTAPATVPPANSPDGRRRIFEVGTTADHAADAVDYATKGRVLSKILQNTTTRSNVFFVWMQIDFFYARDVNPPNGVVRIGAKLPGAASPGYRSFFVIDRSQALSLMNQQYLPSNTTPFVFSTNQSFNYLSLVTFRQRMQ